MDTKHLYHPTFTTAQDVRVCAVLNGRSRGLIPTGPARAVRNVCGDTRCVNWDHWEVRPRRAHRRDSLSTRMALHGFTPVVRVPELGECHEWTASRDVDGYGRLRVQGKLLMAPRVVLALALGRELAPEERAMHLCDNPPCVRAEHIRLGDHTENMRDASAKGRLHGCSSPVKHGTGPELVAFYYGFGQSSYQIAAATGMSASHVRAIIRRMKAASQDQMGEAA